MNAIRAIHPYRHEGLWVFDDETVGLRQEPFVSGADRILDQLAAGIPDAQNGDFREIPCRSWRSLRALRENCNVWD